MKKLILPIIFFLISISLFAQNNGDFRSNQNGNWADNNTWERYDGAIWVSASAGQIPSSTTNQTTILSGHTVTINANAECNNLTVTETLQGTDNTLTVYGNLTNNGVFDLWNTSGTALVFAGTGNATFSGTGGTTDIYTIEVSKDALASTVQLSTSNFSVQGTTASAAKFLTLTTGTFRLSGTFTMSSQVFIGGAAYTFGTGDGFWLDNSNFTIQGQDGQMQFNGLCRMSAGTFNFGDTSPQRFYMNNSSQFIMEGGILNISGAFYAGGDDPITYNQSGGTINVGLLTVTSDWRCFIIDNANADFTMSSGIINVVQTSSAGREYQVDSDAAHTHITGGTLNIGTSATSGNFNFEIQGRMPNTVIDNTTNTKTAIIRGDIWVYDNMTVNGNLEYRDASYDDLTVFGNMNINNSASSSVFQTPTANRVQRFYLYGNLIVDGDLNGFADNVGNEARLYAYFMGTSNTTITGTGTTCEFYDLRVNKGADMTAELDIQRAITLDDGDANDGNRLYVENGTLKFSGTSTTNITPYYNGQNINSATGKFWMTNPNLSINWANAGQTTSRGEFVLDAGSFTPGTGFVIQELSTNGNQINGGSLNVNGNFDMEQDMLISGGTINVSQNFYMDGNGAGETGDLTMTGGILNIGDGDNIFQATGGTGDDGEGGSLSMNNGTINVYGRVNFQNGSGTEVTYFTMSGGNLNIDPQHTTTAAADELFYMEYNSVANCTDGIITFIDPNPNNTSRDNNTFEIWGTAASKNFSGATIQFGDGVSSSAGNADPDYKGFKMRSYSEAISVGDIIINNPGGINREVSINTENAGDNYDFTCNNLIITAGTFDVTRRKLTILENITNTGSLLSLAGSTGEIDFNGTSAQTYSGTGSYLIENLTVNNTSLTGVTLNNDFGGEWVNLTDGHVYTSSTTYLTVHGTTNANLTYQTDGSAYVQGNLQRAIPNNASATDYNFPVGKTNYRLLEMIGITTTGTGTGYITTNVFEGVDMDGRNGGTGIADPTVAESIYWQVSTAMSSVGLDNVGSIRLTYADPATTPPRTIGQSNNNINGPFNSIGRIPAAGTLQSESFDLTGINPTGDAYLIISEVEPLTGTYTVGASGDYLNLTEVAAELRQKFVDDHVYFELLADYDDNTETLPIVFDKLMLTAPSYGVVIRPQLGVAGTVTERDGNAANEALIFIDNVHNLTFDGRPGGIGTSDWTISNTLALNPGAVFEFRNDAYSDTLSYLTTKSDNQSITNGILVFGTTTETNGNDDNLIQYCDITGYSTTPTIGIYSVGTVGADNSGNIVDNCNIYDFFSATEDSKGVNVGANNTNWTISNNKFYQTASRTFTEDQVYHGIHIDNTSGNNFTINGNTIGYATSGGTGITTVNGAASRFAGIWLNVGNGTVTTVQNNVISSISFTTNYNANADCAAFSGIYIQDGSVNIGASGNLNTIGSASAIDNITIQHESNGYSYGIKSLSNDIVNISYNNIGGISAYGLAADDNSYFRGIFTNAGMVTISNNTIGSTSQANSIRLGVSGITTANSTLYGIFNTTGSTANISTNTLANIISHGTGGGGITIGIYSDDGVNTVNNNQIYNLAAYTRRAGTAYSPSIGGIRKTSTDASQEISGNLVHSLSSEHLTTGADVTITGIAFRSNLSTQDVIKQNFIHSFDSHITDAIYTGIFINTGTSLVHNNMVRLGIDAGGNSVSGQLRITGISNSADSPADFYYNSVYIGGSGVTNQVDRNSYAFFNIEAQITQLKNNIFINERSNSAGTDSKHYAIFLTFKDNVISDYNIYNATGTGAVLIGLDNSDYATLQAHRAYFTNQDLYSGVGNPNFSNPTGNAAVVNLHLTGNSSAYQTGIIVASMTEDYDGSNRSGTDGERTNIGADNGSYAITNAEDIFTANFSYTPITNQTPLTDGVVDVTITDQAPAGQGVDQTNVPRVYFRRADSDTPANIENWDINRYYDGVLQSGDGENGIWRFTIEGNGGAFYSDLADNDIIEYFIVAQDQATASPNVWYTKFDATTPDFSNVSTVISWPGAAVGVDFYGIGGNLNGTYTIGSNPSDDFLTLTGSKGFFQNINALNVTGDIIALIQEDITEPATYGCGEWTETGPGGYYVTISTGGATMKTLTTSADNHMIRLEGVDRLIVDGQVSGSGKYLTFEQNNTAFSTFTFSEDATSNVVSNSYIIGSPVLKPIGTIHFGEAVSTGNDNNTISNNIIWNLSANMPDNSIYSRGNVDNTAPNSGNTISNNEIRNFAVAGVWVQPVGNGDGWTISSNTLYNNFSTKPDQEQSGIRIEQGEGHTISGNWIGGSSATLPTSSWENTGRQDFYGIYMDVGTILASNVSNNTIHNIHLSSTAGGPNEFRGVYSVAGLVNITGNNVYNIINDGADYTRIVYVVGTSGISVSNNTISNIITNGNGDFRTFYVEVSNGSTPDLTVNQFQDNIIRGITVNNTGVGIDFYGLYNQNGNFNITGNVIGGNNASDKITFNGGNVFRGFYITGDDFNQNFNNNQIQNIEITSNNQFRGLYIADTDDNVDINIQYNTIENLALNCNTEVIGMQINDGRVLLLNNNFGTPAYGVSNSGTGNMRGLYITTNENNFVVENNTISNIDNAGAIQAIYVDENRPYQLNNNIISGINTANDIAFTGIDILGGNNASLDGNQIEDIVMNNTGSNTSFKGIWVSVASNLTMGTSTANTIGHTSTANSISVAGPNVTGLSLTGTSVVNASNNLIANLTSTSTDVTANIKGLEVDGTGIKTISSNFIRDITTTSTKIDISDGILASQGIWVGDISASSIVSNTIYNISAGGTAAINVAAISENATDVTITKNKIYSISNTTSGSGTASGIVLYNLNAGYIANNMIAIGTADATEYSGIWIPQTNANTKNIYYNSICILDGPTANSYAFLREDNTTPLNIKNNIFANFASAGNRYAVASKNTSGLTNSTINSNCYFSLNAATVGLWGATDNDFDTWITNTAENTENLSTDEQPSFVDATNCNLHLSDYNSACPFNSAGELIAGVTDDWDGDVRDASHPDIGADEFTPTGHSGEYVWRGWTDTDWATASNWQCGFAPSDSPGQTIVVTEGGNNAEIGSDFTADALEIRNNGTLNVTEGNLLTVNGIFTNSAGGSVIVSSSAYLTTNANFNNSGSFRLRSASNNDQSGSYIDAAGTYSNNGAGTFNIERHFIQKQYHYFGIPIQAGGNANSDLFCTSANGNFNANLYTYDETYDISGPPSQEALAYAWEFVRPQQASPDVNLSSDYGYAFYDESDKNITFTGLPNTGDMDVSGLTFTINDGVDWDGWHLVSNPYPSSIDWDAVSAGTLTNLNDAIYVWEGDSYTGTYANYVNGIASGTGNLDRYIATGQSFFVHASAAGAGFVLNNSHRVHSGVKFLKSSSKNNLLKLNVVKEGLSTKTVVYFNQDATSGFDGKFDAYEKYSPWSKAPQIYSITDGYNTELSINALPESEIGATILPMGIISSNGGESTISLESFNGFNDVHVYLEDKTLNKTINLRMQNEHSFELAAGKISDRFILHFNKNNAPVLQSPFGKQDAEQDAAFSFSYNSNVFIDNDLGDSISYSAKLSNGQDLPLWLTFDCTSRTFNGVPENKDVGTVSVQIEATDMLGAIGIYDFDIEVQNVNDSPYLQNPFADKNTLEDQDFNFTFSTNMFVDMDPGDQLSYDAILTNGSNLPDWLSFNAEARTFSGIPENGDVGILSINIKATDSYGEYVSDEFSIEVQNVNDAPEVQNSIVNQNILLGSDYLYYVPENTFNDIDEGDELTLSANLANGEQLPEWLLFDKTIGTFSGTAVQVGEHNVEVTATDKSGASVSTNFKLSVYSTTDIEKLGRKVFSVYPNPSNGKFFVSVNIQGFNSGWDLFIKDIHGKSVYKGKLDSDKKFIDLSGISPGTYFLEFYGENNKVVKTIVIE